jgi:large subunit ribosomal protein L4
MKLKVYSQEGKQLADTDLSDELFGGEINTGLLHQVIKSYLGNLRQGTAKAKGRSEVSGGGRKPFKQKGTGRARAGSNTSPLWVRGGKAFGPDPRDHGVRIPKKLRRSALKLALSDRAQNDKILVIDAMECNKPHTQAIAKLLKCIELQGRRSLLVTDGTNENVYLSGRNIRDVKVVTISSLNALDVVSSDNIVLVDSNLVKKLEEAVTL